MPGWVCDACEDIGSLPDFSACGCLTPRHVDDFCADPKSDPYAVSWFESFRRPAMTKARTPDDRKSESLRASAESKTGGAP